MCLDISVASTFPEGAKTGFQEGKPQKGPFLVRKRLREWPYHVNHHLPEGLALLLGQVLEDVTVLLLEQFEAHGKVVVLQHGFVVVHQGQLGIWGRNTKRGTPAWEMWDFQQPALALGTEMF